MSRYVLDTGALIALDRNDAAMWKRLWTARRVGTRCVTHGGVIAQAVRGPRQARLAQFLPALDVVPLDRELGRQTGYLLAAARTSDVVDAALVVMSRDGDTILTSDPDDIERLVAASGIDATIVGV